ncbi:hypothetical protein TYRP_023381, partial [Tyrophagus putrescentiae]
MSGNPYSGTLHSFIGHADQWKQMSNRINQLWTQMSDKDLQLTIIDKVQKSKKRGNTYLSLLAEQTTIPENSPFFEIEKEIYQFIVKNTLVENKNTQKFIASNLDSEKTRTNSPFFEIEKEYVLQQLTIIDTEKCHRIEELGLVISTGEIGLKSRHYLCLTLL